MYSERSKYSEPISIGNKLKEIIIKTTYLRISSNVLSRILLFISSSKCTKTLKSYFSPPKRTFHKKEEEIVLAYNVLYKQFVTKLIS